MPKKVATLFSKLVSMALLGFLSSGTANAQLIERVFDQFDKYNNISYTASLKMKDFFSDNVFSDTLYARETLGAKPTFRLKGNEQEDIFDGHKVFKLNYKDSTYRISPKADQCYYYDKSLSHLLAKLRKYIKKGVKAIQLNDSVVLVKAYFHLRIKDLDSVVKGRRVFSTSRLLIDKETYLPVFYRNDSEGFIDGTNTFLKIFNEYHFSELKVNLTNLPDLSQVILPTYFSLEKPKVPMALLERGTQAPDLAMTDLNGDTSELTDYKGKLVLLNFSVNGCPHCVESIDMLNDLVSKYKGNLEVVSVNSLDDRASIEKFNEKFKQDYPTFTSSADTGKKFRINGYPTFYLLDSKGEIVKGYLGFSKQISAQIEEEIAGMVQRK
jgi:thiol-disulfide isomerase/thioredoxin